MNKPNKDASSSYDMLAKVVWSLTSFLILTTILSGIILTSSITHAENTKETSNVAVTISTSCTLKGGSDGTSTSGIAVYSASVDPGTTAEINGSKLVMLCNDPYGYSLYAIGYSGDSYTTPTNTQMIGEGSIGNINTSTTTGGNDSSWAMKLATVSGVTPPTILNGFDSYHVIPTNYTQIAKYTSSTATPTSTGAAIQTKYQVYASSGQAAGTYIGKVKYSMVHPNNATPPTTKDISNSTYMQEVGECPASLPVGTINTLIDNRDNQSYIVAKAADGNCWMLQNLKLGKTATAESPITLTPANSDVGSNFVLSGKLSDGKFHAYTINGVANQNNSSEYYCADVYGCYYNWYTATAGTGTTYVTTGNVNDSVCPAGWTLPTGGANGQFKALYDQYPSASQMLVDNPTNTTENIVPKIPGFLLGGYYWTDGSRHDSSNIGHYWARTASNAQGGVQLTITTSSVDTSGFSSKAVGRSIRCVTK